MIVDSSPRCVAEVDNLDAQTTRFLKQCEERKQQPHTFIKLAYNGCGGLGKTI